MGADALDATPRPTASLNYQRIYREFIAARQESPALGYVERHHILPRSLGGGNDADNLLDLTPEDHYFAHLLLAKIHGAKMASALFLLVTTAECKWTSRFASRRSYGFGMRFAARLKSEAWAGADNPLHNDVEFAWRNYRTGETRRATMVSMHAKFGGARSMWTTVANGTRTSIKGWLLEARLEQHKRSEKGQAFEFVNRDGRTFHGTQGEFARAHGINLASASRVIRHRSVTRCGWRRKGVEDRPANYAKDGLPAHQNRKAVATETLTG